MPASDNPRPAPGFPDRVRALAYARERQAESLGNAASVEGFSWTPRPDHRHMILSDELRPGADRPGPPHLWQEFDRAVQRLGIAMEGTVMYVVAFRYRDLAVVMHKIADVARRDTRRARAAATSAETRSESRSAIPGIARLGLRIRCDRRPPRHSCDQRCARCSWWQHRGSYSCGRGGRRSGRRLFEVRGWW